MSTGQSTPSTPTSSAGESSAPSASSRPAGRPGPRVRGTTWAILAVMVLVIAAILGAWQGSESRVGRVPQLTVESGTDHREVPPTSWSTLGGGSGQREPVDFPARDGQTLYLRLPVELRSARTTLFVERGSSREEHPVPAGGHESLTVPVDAPTGRVTLVEVRGVPQVVAADGSEDILNGAWSIRVVPAEPDPAQRR